MDASRIMIGGIPRSGSTWQYNAVRLLLKSAGKPVNAGWSGNYAASPLGVVSVFKAHTPEEGMVLSRPLILTTRRDIIDTLESLVRMGWQKRAFADLRHRALYQLHLYVYWAQRSNHETDYRRIIDQPADELRTLAGILQLKLSDSQIEGVDEALKTMKAPEGSAQDQGIYDTETLLHPRHRATDGGERFVMEPHVAEGLRAELSYWLRMDLRDSSGQKIQVPL